MTHVTRRLTAENLNQLRNPTLGNRVRTTVLLLSCGLEVHVTSNPRPRPDIGKAEDKDKKINLKATAKD